MFGIKIIKDYEYNTLVECQTRFDAITDGLRKEIYCLTKDNTSLREQLNKMITDVQKANLGMNTTSLPKLHNLCIIKNKNYLCDKCKFEGFKCKKLEFANQTICVCDKADVEKFK